MLRLQGYRETVQLLFRPPNRCGLNIVEHYVAILVVEGWHAREHLVGEDAEGPPVRGRGVTYTSEDLRCYVLWSSTERIRLERSLSEAEVAKFKVTISIN